MPEIKEVSPQKIIRGLPKVNIDRLSYQVLRKASQEQWYLDKKFWQKSASRNKRASVLWLTSNSKYGLGVRARQVGGLFALLRE
jgi:hypothetical protein